MSCDFNWRVKHFFWNVNINGHPAKKKQVQMKGSAVTFWVDTHRARLPKVGINITQLIETGDVIQIINI